MLALISLQNSYTDLGLRTISAACRSNGIPTAILWLNREPNQPLSQLELTGLVKWVRQTGCIAVGMNVMSVHLLVAKQITHFIKRHTQTKVIWGGIHAILKPEECLDDADFVCVGEGEETIEHLIFSISQDSIPDNLPNFYYRKGKKLVRNERLIVHDLDKLPIIDHSLKNHWIMTSSGIKCATEALLSKGFPYNHGRHILMTSRGCPYSCTYCCSPALRCLFGNEWVNRFRSVDSVMKEIHEVLESTPIVDTFAIMDDSFFFKPKGWIENFCCEFKNTGAYFGVLLHPKTVKQKHMEMLVDAGLIGIQMGLQSGSERISREIFNRAETLDDFKKAAAILDNFTSVLQSRTYDVIVDNPYESDEDIIETIRVLMSLKKPFNIDLFSLTLYPGTYLYNQYKEQEKPIPASLDYKNKDFINHNPTALNRLIRLTHSNPSWLIGFLLRLYKKSYGKWLIIGIDTCWEKGIRVILRFVKRHLLYSLGHISQIIKNILATKSSFSNQM